MTRADAITDFQQFTGLRAQAQRGDEAAVRKVAQQFEALFTQQLMKNMRSSALASDVMGGGQSDFYKDIFDQQMAVHLSSGKGLGLADVLVHQLRGRQAASPETAGSDAARPNGAALRLPAARLNADQALLQLGSSDREARPQDTQPSAEQLRQRAQTFLQALQPAADQALSPVAPSARAFNADAAALDDGAGDEPSRQFIAAIQPHAERAARELGVPAHVVMAQAALETGWGRHGLRDASGKPAFNFFGIKADRSWQGARVQASTGEYRQGSLQNEQAQFRSYDSPAAAFDDYVDFLKSNPRYAQALRSGGDPAAFAQGLQNAGYATDPAYAQKLLKVANSAALRTAMAAPPRAYAL